ncbi:MAG: PilZ domain-containing protein [Candidatus Omnitrophica bacterium]|nr:PilZ domain-containing protein [Candidatus Omnitrophota bacterium]MCM8790772.1 PilZ domain-containing protein [Candidatus Omnitrophota bacterium]
MVERRRFPRYPIYCPIEYRCENDAPAGSSITLNLCEGGALISTDKRLETGSRLIIKISMKGEIFFLRARVVHVEHDDTIGVYTIGVEFLHSPLDFARKFYDELEAIMLYRRQFAKESGRPISLAEASINWYNLPR